MKKKNSGLLSILLISLFACAISFSGCKEDIEVENGKVNIKLYDARVPQSSNKTTTKGIADADLLTKYEITISSIWLKNSDGKYFQLFSESKTVDLRDFQGIVNSIGTADVPLGNYVEIRIVVSDVSITYNGNTYFSSESLFTTLSIGNSAQSFSNSPDIPNAFSGGPIVFDYPLLFTISDVSDVESIHLQFDAIASAYVIAYSYLTYTWEFAGIRPLLNIDVLLEQGIQQIRYSPPYGITIDGPFSVYYSGIHTFMDFDHNGGVINSHTSQHVFRGADGTLMVDAEEMEINNNALVPNTINQNGESDIRSDETFNYAQIVSNLAGLGYTLVSGQTYYFSLRKTWNITTNGTTYDLTRMCEPIPVVIP